MIPLSRPTAAERIRDRNRWRNGVGVIERREKAGAGPAIPEDVERREFSGPCFACEAPGLCRHRRWG